MPATLQPMASQAPRRGRYRHECDRDDRGSLFFPEKSRDFDSRADLYRTLIEDGSLFFLPGRATYSPRHRNEGSPDNGCSLHQVEHQHRTRPGPLGGGRGAHTHTVCLPHVIPLASRNFDEDFAPMASAAQIAANRQNALKSTGPRTSRARPGPGPMP